MAIEGTPTWKAIADAADDRNASLIVLGTHGRAGLSGLVAGSVAEEVASHSRRPVLVVPIAAEPAPQHRATGQKPSTTESSGDSGNGRHGRGDARARLGASTTVRSG